MRFLRYICIIFLFLFILTPGLWALTEIGTVHNIDKSKKEIIIRAKDVSMGDKLFVIIGNKAVIMSATFPMMTITKCQLDPEYRAFLPRVESGMKVFRYKAGIEKEITKEDSLFTKKKGGSALTVKASKESMIFVVNQEEWYDLLRELVKKQGGSIADKDYIKDLTIKAILNPEFNEKQVTFSLIIYAYGMTGTKTDGKIDKLPAGNYYVWVFSDEIISYQTVTLKNKETKNVFFNVDNQKLFVDSDPSEADIYIDGVHQSEKTPCGNIIIPPEKNRVLVTVKKTDYEDSSQYVNVKQGETSRASFKLQGISLNKKLGGCISPDYSSGGFGYAALTAGKIEYESKYKNQNTFNYNDEEYTEDFSTLIGLDLGYVGRGWGIFSYNLEFGWYDIFIYNFSAGAGLRLGNFYIAANLNYGFDLIQMYDSDYFGYGAKLMYRYNKDSFIGFDWKRVEYVDDTDSGNSFKRTSISLSWGGCF